MPPKAGKDVDLSDELIVKSSDLLFMRDNVRKFPQSSAYHIHQNIHPQHRHLMITLSTSLFTKTISFYSIAEIHHASKMAIVSLNSR